MTFDEFEAWLRKDDQYIASVYDRGDGMCLVIKRLMFHWTMT